jgi:hypothetical protein
MDHPAPLAHENPWRSTALVAAGIAALELLLIVVLAFGIVVRPLLDRDSGAPAATHAAVKAKPAATPAKTSAKPAASTKAAQVTVLARSKTRVLILNGNGRSGAASEKAAYVMAKGYPIAATANAPRSNFARSLVMYRPGHEAEAKRFGKDFGFSRVVPLDGLKKSDLQGAVLVLIIGQQ